MREPLFKLTLFVEPSNSREALSILYEALSFHSYTDYELTILDVSEKDHDLPLGSFSTPGVVSDLGENKIIFTNDFRDVNTLRQTLGFKNT